MKEKEPIITPGISEDEELVKSGEALLEEEQEAEEEARGFLKENVDPDEIKEVLDEEDNEKAASKVMQIIQRVAEASPKARKVIFFAVLSALTLLGGFKTGAFADEPLPQDKKERRLIGDFRGFDMETEILIPGYVDDLRKASEILKIDGEKDIQIELKRGPLGPVVKITLAGDGEIVSLSGMHTKDKEVAFQQAICEDSLSKPDLRLKRSSLELGDLVVRGGESNIVDNLKTIELLKIFAEQKGLQGEINIEANIERGEFGPVCVIVIKGQDGKSVELKTLAAKIDYLQKMIHKDILKELQPTEK